MLASNSLNRLFRAANVPSRMALPRIVLVIPPFWFSSRKRHRSHRGELAPRRVLFHLVPARSVPGIRAREGSGGRHKDEHRGRERGFITGKPVSYANIVLQTLHYRWWAINTPAWSPCLAVLMHSECLSITQRRCPRNRATDRDWWSRSAFLIPSFYFSFSPYCFYVPPYWSTAMIPSLEQCSMSLIICFMNSSNLRQNGTFCVINAIEHWTLKLVTAKSVTKREFAREPQGADVRGHAIKWVWLALLHKFLDTVKWRKGYTCCSQEQIQ